ncbi:MAG: sugar ABC transporter permease [Planctomycetes bacterium]|nr:sugar ABC transporter permease [Planctomycetota bacterium]
MTVRRRELVGFLLPWAVGLFALTILPALASLVLSFVHLESGYSLDRVNWAGLEHYERAIGIDHTYRLVANDPWYWGVLGGRPLDDRFYRSLSNSLIYTALAVPLGLFSSLAVALLLSQSFRGRSLIRGLIYLPHLLGGVATIIIWSWLLNPQFGWINQTIRFLYRLLDPLVQLFHDGGTATWPVPDWLYSPFWCKPAVALMSMWTMGGAMLIFLAALHRVPSLLHDAARIDGAGRWQRFQHVTLPQITPAILFNLVVSIVFSMQSFSESYVLQNRAQDNGLLFYVLHLYEVAFEPPYQLDYASALAWIFFVALFILTAPLVWTSRRWVHYAVQDQSL